MTTTAEIIIEGTDISFRVRSDGYEDVTGKLLLEEIEKVKEGTQKDLISKLRNIKHLEEVKKYEKYSSPNYKYRITEDKKVLYQGSSNWKWTELEWDENWGYDTDRIR